MDIEPRPRRLHFSIAPWVVPVVALALTGLVLFVASRYMLSVNYRDEIPVILLENQSPDKSWSIRIVKVCHDLSVWCEVYGENRQLLLRIKVTGTLSHFEDCDDPDHYFCKLLIDNDKAEFGSFQEDECHGRTTIIKKDVMGLLK